MSGQDEPRLVGARAIGDEQTNVFWRVAGRVEDIDDDVAKRKTVAVLDFMHRKGDFRRRMQNILGAGLARERAPRGSMIGVDMGVDDEVDTHPRLVRHTEIWSYVADRIDDRAGRMPAATEQVGNRHGILVQELAQDHKNLPTVRDLSAQGRASGLTISQ